MRWSWASPVFGCFGLIVGCVGSVDGSRAAAHETGGGSNQVQANHWMNPTLEHAAPLFREHASPLV
ncbi:MAG TPA: hypothetical protein VGY54_22175, partial [Polyangiaceae bacterium]|nr:hypothetical protein [Polyangiaceae bacterium]